MTSGTLAREIRGETLLLHPERALSWPARRMLVIADTHFGKGSLFARNGIAVPGGTDTLDLERINSLLLTDTQPTPCSSWGISCTGRSRRLARWPPSSTRG